MKLLLWSIMMVVYFFIIIPLLVSTCKHSCNRKVLILIFLFYTNFYIIYAVHIFKPFIMVGECIKPYMSSGSKFFFRIQNRVGELLTINTGSKRVLFWATDEIAYTVPNKFFSMKYFWFLLCGPVGTCFFVFFYIGSLVSEPVDPFSKFLNRYRVNIPPKIDFTKLQETAKEQAKKGGYNFTFLGYNAIHKTPAIITDEERVKHVQVIGSTGSGKTHYVLLPMIKQDIERGRGIVFIDAKGDSNTIKTLYKLVKDAGREKDFLIFNMSNPEQSNTYNPLLLGNPVQLKDKIIGSIHFTEPHYQRECENGLQMLFTEWLKKRVKVTLPELNQVLLDPTDEFPLFCDFFDKHNKNITGIQNEISLMVNTPFGQLFNSEDINLLDVCLNKKIAYFVINTLTYGETGRRFGRLITGDINTVCGMIQNMDARQGNELAVFIDEYKAFGTKKFTDTLSQGRSAGFMITISHQSLGDLQAISEEHPVQVKECTNTRIILKVNDPDTAEQFSSELGTYKTSQLTRQIIFDKQKPDVEVGTMGTEKIVDEFYVHPQQIKELRQGQAYYKTSTDWGMVVLKPIFFDLKDMNLPDFNSEKQTDKRQIEKSIENIPKKQVRNIFEV
ncbi:MAG: type IV secretion system DNA-binding domain-containing protein [Elusimicrobia bacterium]|nr:type IV secretion system DNA-binding domain-containing protein [Elusimicrobiota bacterium]